MLLAAQHVGVSRVLVELAEWLDEGHFGKLARARGGDEFRLVLQMLGATGCAIGEVRVVGERLMMILEQLGGMTGESVVPSA